MKNKKSNKVFSVLEEIYISHTHLNTSDPSDSIMDNAYISSALPKTFAEVNIFLLVYTLLLV